MQESMDNTNYKKMEYKVGKQNKRSRNGLQVMGGLIGMVKPLIGFMCIAIIMGCIGNLMAIFITVLGGLGVGALAGFFPQIQEHIGVIFGLLITFALLRGVLRYAEQASNHYIAFRLLARIRHQVFACLRRLAPAKLEGSDKGNLISIITSDIELLEVFYAHTISPIAIAVITSIVMSLFIGHYDYRLGLIAAGFYLIVGLLIPVCNSHAGQKYGRQYRDLYGELNTTVLDNLYGLDEILQYDQSRTRMERMDKYTKNLEKTNEKMKGQEAWQRIITDSVILVAGVVMLLAAGHLVIAGTMSGGQAVVCVIAMMSSFGPTAALSALSNNLNQTLASGNRVLDLLAEKPVTEEITDKRNMNIVEENTIAAGNTVVAGNAIAADHVTFSYGGEQIFQDFNAEFAGNGIHAVIGKSGCGKSTLLKLLMRFYETDQGKITYNEQDVNEINTSSLRDRIAYVTQETFLFEDTIENNIRIADEKATREQIIEAAKKASIHEFIMSLPNGYDTMLKELGDSVSGGERQRIGLARAFLHQADILLLDEPTSNIDSLNEGIILKSLNEAKKDKTILLVSHRRSTLGVADTVLEFN